MGRTLSYLMAGSGAERQLVEGLRRGERRAIALYEVFAPRLARVITRIYRDPQLADDAVQATPQRVSQDRPVRRPLRTVHMDHRDRHSRGTRLSKSNSRQRARVEQQRQSEAPDPPRSRAGVRQPRAEPPLDALIAELPVEKRTALLLSRWRGSASRRSRRSPGNHAARCWRGYRGHGPNCERPWQRGVTRPRTARPRPLSPDKLYHGTTAETKGREPALRGPRHATLPGPFAVRPVSAIAAPAPCRVVPRRSPRSPGR